MKKSLLILIVFLYSCNTYNYIEKNDKIIYDFQNLKLERTLDMTINSFKSFKDVFIVFDIEKDTYTFWIIPTNHLTSEKYGFLNVLKSNRLVLINGKLYNLVFSTDEKFGTKLNTNNIITLDKKEKLYEKGNEEELEDKYSVIRRTTLYDYAKKVSFDKDWNLVQPK